MQTQTGPDDSATLDFESLYREFDAPINELDCGIKCAPYNALGVPFCCDIQQTIPTAYIDEWAYLKSNTDLWRLWSGDDPQRTEEITKELPCEQVPVVCLGSDRCQRDFRTITCRAFPFFPYLTSQGEFIGLTYYWEYEDRCWVISNLHVVDTRYILQFVAAFEVLLKQFPDEISSYQSQSDRMRHTFEKDERSIILLRHDGQSCMIDPGNERICKIQIETAPKYGPYKLAAQMPFPNEF